MAEAGGVIGVVVDPGHGGKDPGAVCGDVREADVNLAVGLVLAELLRARGYGVTMTRIEEGQHVGLDERCRIANRSEARCFVSVHCNSEGEAGAGARKASGVECLYMEGSERGKRLAELVQRRLVAVTGARDRGVKTRQGLAVLRGTSMPAVLVECGFLSNAAERMLLGTPGYRQAVAGAVAEGVDEYLRPDGE